MSYVLERDAPLLIRLLLKHGEIKPGDLERLSMPVSALPANPEAQLLEAGLADERLMARRMAEYIGCSWFESDPADPLQLLECFPPDKVRPRGALAELSTTCREAIARVPENVFRNRRVLPLFLASGTLHVIASDPLDFSASEEIRMVTGLPVAIHVCTVSVYRLVLQQVFGDRDKMHEALGEAGAGGDEDGDGAHAGGVDLNQSIANSKDTAVLRLVNSIILQAMEDGASDIHCEPYETCVRVRYRVDGQLREVAAPPPKVFQHAISRMKILARMDIAEKRVPQDGAISVRDGDRRVDLRVSTVPTVYGEKMVLRLLEKTSLPSSLTALGFSERQAADFMDAAQCHHGLMFVTGPTGSGKSTTLYTCLGLINGAERNILTVEDPVEQKLHGLNQVQVHTQAGLTFASALRSFLRQDPDVIMVGEVRDTETAQICMRAALTGHLVLSTLHTNNSLQVIYRLVDMGIEPFLLGPALRLLEAQRLVRRLCPQCKREQQLPAETARQHGLPPGATVWRAGDDASCSACKGRGIKGRLGLYEVIRITEDLQDLIAARTPLEGLREHLTAKGVKFLADDARAKLLAGSTSFAEVADYIRVD
jgi:type IV pilus assembly protein PilB